MNRFAPRRVLWDYVGGALWVLPTLSVLLFPARRGDAVSGAGGRRLPAVALAFQGTAEDARGSWSSSQRP